LSGQRFDLGSELSASIAGVDDAAGLQQENTGLWSTATTEKSRASVGITKRQ
jgi:hypothetical protein